MSQVPMNLSPAKQALLAQRLRNAHQGHALSRTIPSRPAAPTIPLSFAQERLWFLEQLEPGHPVYNRPMAIRLVGRLNIPLLEQSLAEILRRHEVLRATFTTVEGQPLQLITPVRPVRLPVTDLSELPLAKRESQMLQLAAAEAQRSFELTQGPLVRAALLRLDQESHILLLVVHRLAFDGWSAKVLLSELATLYAAFATGNPSPLPELPIQYADYAHWQRQRLQGELLAAQLAYWQGKLAGAAMLDLPADHPRPAQQSYQGACQSLILPSALVQALKTLSQQEKVTLFMTLLAAFKLLLYRYTGQEDILVGSPIAGRTQVETEPLIGFFINTLVLRTDLSGNPTFRELLKRVRQVALEAYAHQDLPFEKLVAEIDRGRDRSRSPMFQVMFNLENIPHKAVQTEHLRFSEFEFDPGITSFDLHLEIITQAEELVCLFYYSTDLFEAATISRMSEHFQALLTGIIANPDLRLSTLPPFIKQERPQAEAIQPSPVKITSTPPIGRPIPKVQVYILDAHLQPAPVGVPGELYLGGAGLARGYLNRPELTAEKFIPNPFIPPQPPLAKGGIGGDKVPLSKFSPPLEKGGLGGDQTRLYKTGDLARYLPDGRIEFLGRIDQQVKIRGFRIELGEIEAALRQHPEVQEAVVLAREDTPGEKRLVSYIVPKSAILRSTQETDVEMGQWSVDNHQSSEIANQNRPQLTTDHSQLTTLPQALRPFLKTKLPDYMIPTAFVLLETLPLTPSGKIDRRALPAPDPTRSGLTETFVAPRTPVEAALATIWMELLHLERVGAYDNFFELGGHSLLATQVISRLRHTFQVDLPLRSLFERPSLAGLAQVVEESQVNRAQAETAVIKPVSRQAYRLKR